MNKEQIEGSKLIAQFDGWTFLPNGNCWHERYNDHGQQIEMLSSIVFLYYESWEWLMPVVEKIEKLLPDGYIKIVGQIAIGKTTFKYDCEICIDWANDISVEYSSETSKIECVFQAVVSFIQWYNNQTKNS